MADDASILKDMNVLVTGGFGFIGVATVVRLRSYGARVRILDNLSVGALSDLPAPGAPLEAGVSDWSDHHVQYVVGDLLDEDACSRAAAGAEAIIHLGL